jgi:AcrR family transcriptional regulator
MATFGADSATASSHGTPAGRRILDAASDLFYTRGIGVVGVELIADTAGVTKKTLYDRFGSKARLVETYLRARDERWREFLTSYVEARGGSPRDRVLAVFDGLGEWMRNQSNGRGCGFVNASAELTDPHHPGLRAIAEQKQWVREYLEHLVRGASLSEPDLVTRQLILLFEGACVANGLGLDDDAAAIARAAAERLIESEPGTTRGFAELQ